MSVPASDHAPAPSRPPTTGWLAPDAPFAPRRWPFFYGWVIVVASTIGVACSVPGQTIGFTAFTDILMRQTGLDRGQISLAYGLGTGLSGLLLTRAGRYFDRHGARRTIILAALCFGLALAYLSVCDWSVGRLADPTAAFAAVFASMCMGFFLVRFFGQGVMTMSSRAMLSKWFDARRGLAINVSAVVVACAFSIAPRILDDLMHVLGWRGAYLTLAVTITAVVALTGWLLARDNPEECGLEMDGGIRPAATAHNPDLILRRDFTRAEAVRTFPFWVANLTVAWFALLVTACSFHFVAIGAEKGMARDTILDLFIPMGAASIAGSFFFAWWCDRTRMKWVILAACLAMTLYALGARLFPSDTGRWLFILGGGLAGSAFQTMTGVVWARFYGRRELGAISGFNMACIVVASAMGPYLFSLLADLSGGFGLPLSLSVGVGLVLAVACFWADNPQRKL